MGTVIRIPSLTWLDGVNAEADLPASGNQVYDARISLTDESIFFWNGTSWVEIVGGGGGGGVDTVGAFGSAPNTGGASISGDTITLQPADATRPGGIATGAQTIPGAKTFASAPIFSALTATTVPYLDASKVLTSSAVTPTELGYVSGVTSAIQTQMNLKAPLASPVFTTSARFSYATASTVPYWDASKDLVSSAVTPTELGYVSGVTSAIQTQLGTKAPLASPTFTTSARFNYATASTVPYLDSNKDLISSAVTPTELGYLSGVTSAIQTQLGLLAPKASPTFTGVALFASGSVTNPSIAGSSATTSGMYFDGTLPSISRAGVLCAQFSSTAFYASLQTGQANYGFYYDNGITVNRGLSGNVSLLQTKIGTTTFAQGETMANVGGVRWSSITAAGNVGGGEDDLHSKALAQNALGASENAVVWYSYGTIAAVANTKQIRVKFGSTTIADSGAVDVAGLGGSYEATAIVIRTGAATQIAFGRVSLGYSGGTSASTQTVSSPTETLANAITIKSTGEATTTDDISEKYARIMWFPAGNA